MSSAKGGIAGKKKKKKKNNNKKNNNKTKRNISKASSSAAPASDDNSPMSSRRASSAPPPSTAPQQQRVRSGRRTPPSTVPPQLQGDRAPDRDRDRPGPAIGALGGTAGGMLVTSHSTGALSPSMSSATSFSSTGSSLRQVTKSSSYSRVVFAATPEQQQATTAAGGGGSNGRLIESSSALHLQALAAQAAHARRHMSDTTQGHLFSSTRGAGSGSHNSLLASPARRPHRSVSASSSSSTKGMGKADMAVMSSSNSIVLDVDPDTGEARMATLPKVPSSAKRSKVSTVASAATTSTSQLVPKGYVSVTRAQKAFAAIGFIWVCTGLLMTTVVAALVFFGRREQLLQRATKLGGEGGATEWIVPIFTGLVFVPLFAALAFGVAMKAWAAVTPTPQALEMRTVSLDPDDDDDDIAGAAAAASALVMGQGMPARSSSARGSVGGAMDGLPRAASMQGGGRSASGNVGDLESGTLVVASSKKQRINGTIVEDSSGLLFSDDDDDDDDSDDDEDDDDDDDDDYDDDDNDAEQRHERRVNSNNYSNSRRRSTTAAGTGTVEFANLEDLQLHHRRRAHTDEWRELYRRGASYLAWQPAEPVVERMMRQLRDMGFGHAHENIAALQASGFDLEKAADKLSQAQCDTGAPA